MSETLELSKDQLGAYDYLMDWLVKPNSKYITFGGYAGCGKTTLIGVIRRTLPAATRVAMAAYTGKAASVLKRKLHSSGISKYMNDYIGTIHGLIYEPLEDKSSGDFLEW